MNDWTDFVSGVKDCQSSILLAVVLLLTPPEVMASISEMTTISDLPKNATFIDTRPSPDCKRESVSGASCLVSKQLLYPNGRLASFRDINWLLGTLGIDVTKPVIVVGDQPLDRRFVAGVLYLAGLPEVVIASVSVSALIDLHGTKQGRQSGILRVSYLDMLMRDQSLLVDNDLSLLLNTPDIRLSTLDKNVWLITLPHNDHVIITAAEPGAAISWYAKLLTTSPDTDKIFVHADGLTPTIKARLVNFGAEVS